MQMVDRRRVHRYIPSLPPPNQLCARQLSPLQASLSGQVNLSSFFAYKYRAFRHFCKNIDWMNLSCIILTKIRFLDICVDTYRLCAKQAANHYSCRLFKNDQLGVVKDFLCQPLSSKARSIIQVLCMGPCHAHIEEISTWCKRYLLLPATFQRIIQMFWF